MEILLATLTAERSALSIQLTNLPSIHFKGSGSPRGALQDTGQRHVQCWVMLQNTSQAGPAVRGVGMGDGEVSRTRSVGRMPTVAQGHLDARLTLASSPAGKVAPPLCCLSNLSTCTRPRFPPLSHHDVFKLSSVFE